MTASTANPPGIGPIHTERLTLRELDPADLEAVHEYASDPFVTSLLVWGPNSRRDTRDFLRWAAARRGVEPRRDYDLAVTRRSDGALIGGIGLHIESVDEGRASLGFVIHPKQWMRGYATEAARGLIDFAFSELGLERVEATCDVDNAASSRVLEKVGMTKQGRLRQHLRLSGNDRDCWLYSIVRRR